MRSPLTTVRSSLFALLYAGLGMAGCFAEVQDPPAGSGPTCDPGTLGCECANGLCEMDLECAPANICTPLNCLPGTAICECDLGERCDGDLICNTGVCLPVSTGTGTSGEQPTTSAGPTSSMTTITTSGDPTTGSMSDSITMTMTTDSMTTVSMTTNVDTTLSTDSDTSSSTTQGPIDCADVSAMKNDCGACFDCTDQMGEACAGLATTCASTPGCQEVVGCLTTCKADGLCFDDCCDEASSEAVMAAQALSVCHQDNCISDFCLEFIDAECNDQP